MTQYAIHEGMSYHFMACHVVEIISTKGDWVTYKNVSIDLEDKRREDQESNGTKRAKKKNFFAYTDSFELAIFYKNSLREIGKIIWDLKNDLDRELTKLARSL